MGHGRLLWWRARLAYFSQWSRQTYPDSICRSSGCDVAVVRMLCLWVSCASPWGSPDRRSVPRVIRARGPYKFHQVSFYCMLGFHFDVWMQALGTATYSYRIWICLNECYVWFCTHFPWLCFGIQYDMPIIMLWSPLKIYLCHVHFSPLTTQETWLGLVYLLITTKKCYFVDLIIMVLSPFE